MMVIYSLQLQQLSTMKTITKMLMSMLSVAEMILSEQDMQILLEQSFSKQHKERENKSITSSFK